MFSTLNWVAIDGKLEVAAWVGTTVVYGCIKKHISFFFVYLSVNRSIVCIAGVWKSIKKFVFPDTGDTYDSVVDALIQHFIPTVNVVVEFMKRVQAPHKSIQQYVATLQAPLTVTLKIRLMI